MKIQLIQILELPDNTADTAIIDAVERLKSQTNQIDQAAAEEKAIAALIAESCGALNRESAKEVFRNTNRPTPN